MRLDEDGVLLCASGRTRIEHLERRVETFAAEFWRSVRFSKAAFGLRGLLEKIGYPGHARRIRLAARIHELICETNLHAGELTWSISSGLRAYQLYRVAFHEANDPHDLAQVGRVARLLSQAHLLLRETARARVFLEIHAAAHQRLGLAPQPEYYHQLSTALFQTDDPGADRLCHEHLVKAMNGLAETVDIGVQRTSCEVMDIGLRQTNLLRPARWEKSEELMENLIRHYAPDDIHISLNVGWTAACGLSLDSPNAQQRALDFLRQYDAAAKGYLRQQATFDLLRLTSTYLFDFAHHG